jgi:NitT/TauT family transport system permease protein
MNNYLKSLKKQKLIILIWQFSIAIILILLWEFLSQKNIINSFIFSSPSKIINTISNLIQNNSLSIHIITTLKEVLISFILGISLGFIIAIILYEFPILYKIIDPYLTMLNSLPKVALGPLIIIIVGANTKSIIVMALLINLINIILTIYNGFINTDSSRLKIMQSFKASKFQILTKLVIPNSYSTIISSLKICLANTLIGVIMGEFLVSKSGLGYLIIYGTQVFNLSLVMSGIFILLIISFVLYKVITYIEKKLLKK